MSRLKPKKEGEVRWGEVMGSKRTRGVDKGNGKSRGR